MLNINKPYSLSVIIIAQDEEDRIEACLKSVSSIADEIIVLDSGSTDRTVEIAKAYSEKVFETDWPGYGPQKQRALEKATSEWVLSIDADEALSTELFSEIHEVLSASPDAIGFKLPWAVTIFGRTLNHGRSARAPLRLFRRDGARFSNDMVHEKILLPKGKIKKLNGRLLHFTHRDFGHYMKKNRHYAWLGAQKRFASGKAGFGLTGATLRALWTFIQIYFIRLGFLDGRVGFLVAVMYSQGSFNKYAGLWTLRHQAFLKQKAEALEDN
jgi:O-antigen ligase